MKSVAVGIRLVMASLLLASLGTHSLAQSRGDIACGDLSNSFGPFDYRTADPKDRHLVEGTHFTASVETLQRGSAGYLGGDIDYTLRAFPNHVRALVAMEKLGRKEGERPFGARWPVACYFDRAIRFAPDDGAVRVAYAIYLSNRGASREALVQLEIARGLVGGDASVYYNMGLVYFDLKQYDEALEYAHRAYALGFPLPGLRNMLVKAGRWRDAEPAAKASRAEPGSPALGVPETNQTTK